MRHLNVCMDTLKKSNKRVAVAESCTGGKLASAFTSIPGASDVFTLGVVTYSNEAKQRVLEISEGVLSTHGAVSTLVAEQMAKKVRTLGAADIGISTTGIAGPGGGTDLKPVGTVYVSIATKDTVSCRALRLSGDRESIQNQVVESVLEWLTDYI